MVLHVLRAHERTKLLTNTPNNFTQVKVWNHTLLVLNAQTYHLCPISLPPPSIKGFNGFAFCVGM